MTQTFFDDSIVNSQIISSIVNKDLIWVFIDTAHQIFKT